MYTLLLNYIEIYIQQKDVSRAVNTQLIENLIQDIGLNKRHFIVDDANEYCCLVAMKRIKVKPVGSK